MKTPPANPAPHPSLFPLEMAQTTLDGMSGFGLYSKGRTCTLGFIHGPEATFATFALNACNAQSTRIQALEGALDSALHQLEYIANLGREDATDNPVILSLRAALLLGNQAAQMGSIPSDLLDTLNAAICRVELANGEGNPILSAWLPDARAILAKYRTPGQTTEARASWKVRLYESATSTDPFTSYQLDNMTRAKAEMEAKSLAHDADAGDYRLDPL